MGYNIDITLSIDADIVNRVSKIAAGKDTTLEAMVAAHLTSVVESDAAERKALADKFRKSVEKYGRDMGPRTRTRDDLYDRPKRYYR